MPKTLENTREDFRDFFDSDLSKTDPKLYNSITNSYLLSNAGYESGSSIKYL